jgi:hypothetical protein
VAAAGAIQVGGTVGGVAAQPGSDTVMVDDRAGWTWNGDYSETSETPGHYECNQLPHYQTTTMGWTGGTECGDQTYIFTPFWTDSTSGAAGGISVAQIADGPNTGLWYVTDIAVRLDLHSQVLKDLRPDGAAYSFTASSDSATTAACSQAGASSPTTLTTTNLTCWNNSDYSAFYSRTWQHEQCHMKVAVASFDSLPDAKTLGERVVGASASDARSGVIYQANGLSDASSAIIAASKQIDYLPGSTYRLRWFDPSTSSWPAVSKSFGNGLASGC